MISPLGARASIPFLPSKTSSSVPRMTVSTKSGSNGTVAIRPLMPPVGTSVSWITDRNDARPSRLFGRNKIRVSINSGVPEIGFASVPVAAPGFFHCTNCPFWAIMRTANAIWRSYSPMLHPENAEAGQDRQEGGQQRVNRWHVVSEPSRGSHSAHHGRGCVLGFQHVHLFPDDWQHATDGRAVQCNTGLLGNHKLNLGRLDFRGHGRNRVFGGSAVDIHARAREHHGRGIGLRALELAALTVQPVTGNDK